MGESASVIPAPFDAKVDRHSVKIRDGKWFADQMAVPVAVIVHQSLTQSGNNGHGTV